MEAVGRIGFLFLATPAASTALRSGHSGMVGTEGIVDGVTVVWSVWGIVTLRESGLPLPSSCGGDGLETGQEMASLEVISNCCTSVLPGLTMDCV